MNEKWREILVEAALNGHVQMHDQLHDMQNHKDCALGVIHISFHSSREDAIKCYRNHYTSTRLIRDYHKEDFPSSTIVGEIVDRNDRLKEDFLTIARKTGQNASQTRNNL